MAGAEPRHRDRTFRRRLQKIFRPRRDDLPRIRGRGARFGWIDGIVRKVDGESYCHRFTPRKPGSIWSNVNVAHVTRLIAAGRMHPAGLAAFAARTEKKTGIYAFERTTEPELPAAFARKFRARKAAWKFFAAQPPGYRRLLLHKIVSPKQAATRERWLDRVIAASAAGKRLE